LGREGLDPPSDSLQDQGALILNRPNSEIQRWRSIIRMTFSRSQKTFPTILTLNEIVYPPVMNDAKMADPVRSVARSVVETPKPMAWDKFFHLTLGRFGLHCYA